jgi:hypothetical protein
LNHDKPSGSLTQVHSDSSGKCLSNLAWTFDHWGPSIPDTQILEKNKTHYNINYPSHKSPQKWKKLYAIRNLYEKCYNVMFLSVL